MGGILENLSGGFLSWLVLGGMIILVGNIILSGLIVFFERRNPSSTWAWLLVLLFVPVLGFIVYMVFGRNSRREKMFLKKEEYDRAVYRNDVAAVRKNREQKKQIRNNEQLVENEYVTDLIHMHLNSGSWITFNNQVDYYNNGKDKFEALIEDIRKAKKHIHLE
ncbi:MAG: PLDc N-terminal domain-containing protein, partial [Anaerotignum sp.]|nr:PLDc N-terminal domain-containing protein [Anaerotignum sp.]